MPRLFNLKGTSSPSVLVLWVFVGACVTPSASSRELLAQESPDSGTTVEFKDGDPLAAWARGRLADLNASSEPNQTDLELRLERIRAMYFLSVEEKNWVDRTKDSLRAIRSDIPEETREEVTFQAYRGALEVVRAKHARWPGNKLMHLNRGSEILDGLIVRDPDNLEVRYLRLASYMFLPFFLRRDESVASDLQRLASALPDHPEAFSPAVYQAVVQFVLDNGGLDQADRERLREALRATPATQLQKNQRVESNG